MFEKIEKFVACACVAVMAVLVFANVVARFVFKHSLAVSDEMSTYLFVLMSFMGHGHRRPAEGPPGPVYRDGPGQPQGPHHPSI